MARRRRPCSPNVLVRNACMPGLAQPAVQQSNARAYDMLVISCIYRHARSGCKQERWLKLQHDSQCMQCSSGCRLLVVGAASRLKHWQWTMGHTPAHLTQAGTAAPLPPAPHPLATQGAGHGVPAQRGPSGTAPAGPCACTAPVGRRTTPCGLTTRRAGRL